MLSMVKAAAETETQDVSLHAVLAAIRAGRWREPIEEIRAVYNNGSADPRKAIGPFKKKLPAIMFSGRFERRANDALVEHSGIIVADFDELGSEQATVSEKLRSSLHVSFMFKSPSGEGLKVGVKVPADAARHADSFRAIAKHVYDLTGVRVDESGKDVARLCYVSYDPDLEVFDDAVAIEPLPPEPKKSRNPSENVADLPTRQRIAVEVVGQVTWDSDTHGLLERCPGQHLHTTDDGERDCEIHLYGAPTVHCFHDSCCGIVDGVNRELRSRIGKAEGATEHANASAASDASADDAEEMAAIRGEIIAILSDKKLSSTVKSIRVGKIVRRALTKRGRFFYHAERRDFDSAMFFDKKRKRLERIRSDAFQAWLSSWVAINRAATGFNYMTAEIETVALSSKDTTGIIPESFWASRPAAFYLSQSDAEMVKITANGSRRLRTERTTFCSPPAKRLSRGRWSNRKTRSRSARSSATRTSRLHTAPRKRASGFCRCRLIHPANRRYVRRALSDLAKRERRKASPNSTEYPSSRIRSTKTARMISG